MATPAPIRARPQSTTTAAAASPRPRVSQPRRFAGADSALRFGSAVSVGVIRLACSLVRAQEDLAQTHKKANRTQNQHAPRLGLQPAVEQEPKHTSAQNAADEQERQLRGERELARHLAGPV